MVSIVAKVIIRRRIPVTAIHGTELVNLLKRIGEYENVVKGFHKCIICGEIISLDNIGGIAMSNGKIVFVCNKPSCLLKFMLVGRETRH